jgi:hypothetical protein
LPPVDQKGRGLLGGASNLAAHLSVAVGTGNPPENTQEVSETAAAIGVSGCEVERERER